jgi:hypothetical protein
MTKHCGANKFFQTPGVFVVARIADRIIEINVCCRQAEANYNFNFLKSSVNQRKVLNAEKIDAAQECDATKAK